MVKEIFSRSQKVNFQIKIFSFCYFYYMVVIIIFFFCNIYSKYLFLHYLPKNIQCTGSQHQFGICLKAHKHLDVIFAIILSTALQVCILFGAFSPSLCSFTDIKTSAFLQVDVGFVSLTHVVYPNDTLHDFLISKVSKYLIICFSPKSSQITL